MVAFLICFDMDGTLLDGEPLEILAREFGKEGEVKKITDLAMAGTINFKESVALRLSLLKGLETRRIREISKTLPLVEGAEELIGKLKKTGFHVAMITGGFDSIAEIIAEKLKIDEFRANKLEEENGVLTGGFNLVVNENKDRLLREIAERINANLVIAVGDGANDMPMLKAADIGIGFRVREILSKEVKHPVKRMAEIERLLIEKGLL